MEKTAKNTNWLENLHQLNGSSSLVSRRSQLKVMYARRMEGHPFANAGTTVFRLYFLLLGYYTHRKYKKRESPFRDDTANETVNVITNVRENGKKYMAEEYR